MTEPTHDLTVIQIATLLMRYGFEMRGYTALELIERWLKIYRAMWIRLAVVEALYQGRYKAISVEQILRLWLRRGNPTFHFSHEFDSLICRNLPQAFPISSNLSEALESENGLRFFEQGVSELAKIDRDVEENPSLATDDLVFQENGLTDSNKGELTALSVSSETNWSHFAASERTIHEFTPLLDRSEFYVKLRAVARQSLEEEERA